MSSWPRCGRRCALAGLEVLRRHDAAAAGRVDQVVEGDPALLAVLVRPVRRDRAAVVELEVLDRGVLVHVDADLAGVVEQDLVELGAHHLPGVGPVLAQFAEDDLPLVRAPEEVRAALGLEAVLLDLLPHPELFEDRAAGREDRLADVVARKAVPFQEGHTEPLLGEQARRRGSGGPTPDDQDLGRSTHEVPPLSSVPSQFAHLELPRTR